MVADIQRQCFAMVFLVPESPVNSTEKPQVKIQGGHPHAQHSE